MTDVLSEEAPNKFYQGFYLYLYIGSIAFVAFMYIDHLRFRRMYAAHNSNGNIFINLLLRKKKNYIFLFTLQKKTKRLN